MAAYRTQMQAALDEPRRRAMQDDWKPTNRTILQNNIAFMDECLKNNVITVEALAGIRQEAGAAPERRTSHGRRKPRLHHWMDVLAGWKQMLGADWDKTYAASNTIYVARQNNVLFSVLAQFFGPEAINDRLMLIETISFTTTPDDMLEFADPHHRRPLGRCGVLRQLLFDGLRADGRRRAPSDHRRGRQAQHDTSTCPRRCRSARISGRR